MDPAEIDPQLLLLAVPAIVLALGAVTALMVVHGAKPRGEGVHELALKALAHDHDGLTYTAPSGPVEATVHGRWQGAQLEAATPPEGVLRDLAAGSGAVALRAAEALGADAPPALQRLLGDEALSVRVGAACALAAAGPCPAAVQEVLIEGLRGEVVVGDVIRALDQVGDARAVPALQQTASSHRHAPVRAKAREAIDTIQARVGADAAGQLALAEARGGEVSLVAPRSDASAGAEGE